MYWVEVYRSHITVKLGPFWPRIMLITSQNVFVTSSLMYFIILIQNKVMSNILAVYDVIFAKYRSVQNAIKLKKYYFKIFPAEFFKSSFTTE